MKKVAVAMSGGVDSSVAALLLKKKGYDATGITLCLGVSDQDGRVACCGSTAVNDARSVCTLLGIPHFVLDYSKHLKKYIIDHFVSEYMAGRTPNPCIRCNQYLKFRILLQFIRDADYEYLATGHYANIQKNKTFYILNRGKDKTKDQSYFLYTLTQKELPYLLFPVGSLTKSKVRDIARTHNLPVAQKKESQEICFIENNDYTDFLKKYAHARPVFSAQPGPIYDITGSTIGYHQGFPFYTIGQRKGLQIKKQGPWYVVKINPHDNSLIAGMKTDVYTKELVADNITWVSGNPPKKNIAIKAQIRYRHMPALVQRIADAGCNRLHVHFVKPQYAVTPGQSIVLYQGKELLGGGIIKESD